MFWNGFLYAIGALAGAVVFCLAALVLVVIIGTVLKMRQIRRAKAVEAETRRMEREKRWQAEKAFPFSYRNVRASRPD